MAGERKKTVLAIPDLHLPWANWKKVDKLYRIVDDMKIDVVIQLGDLYDQYSFSRFARSHDLMTPEEEIVEAREGAEGFWRTIHKMHPRAQKLQLVGNHDVRLLARAADRYPEIASFLNKISTDLYKFKNVKTIHDARDGVQIEDVLYIHGFLTTLGAHMKHFGKNIVHGHCHRGGTLYQNYMGKTLFEVDAGFLADRTAVPLQYGQTKHMHWVEGFAIVDPLGGRFIPL